MKVLLAGATGAVGRPLLSALAQAGHEVLAIVRNPGRSEIVTGLGAVPVVADVLDREALLKAVTGLRADVVMHQATALREPPRKLTEADQTLRLRDAGSRHLIDAAAEVGATRFVTQSLITGYGYRDHGDHVLTEDDEFGVLAGNVGDLVTRSTVRAERLPQEAGLDTIALRYGMFYGPDAFSDMFATLMRKRVPLLPMGESATTSFVHVHDAASAAVAAMERGTPGAAYNIVDGRPMSWREFATAVAGAHGTPSPKAMPKWLLRRVSGYLACLLIDTTLRVSNAKATAELGWTPKHLAVPEGLAAHS